MTPLIELLPGYMRPRRARGNDPPPDDLSVVVDQIADSWGSSPIFVDTGMVRDVPHHGVITRNLERFFAALAAAGVQAIPVTSSERPASFQDAIREAMSTAGNGVAIRVPLRGLLKQTVGSEFGGLVRRLGSVFESVDIVVEYGLVTRGAPPFSYICHRLPQVEHSRTFTILAGSFPPDLMEFKKPGQYEVPREEWKHWVAEIVRADSIPRLPTFGDYTIQHPVYHEPIKGANPTASVRYTSDGYWVIMRGEGLRNPGGPGYAQYPANAELLCGRKEFCGPTFSAGDRYIYTIASHEQNHPGTPETWLRAGINHHLVFVGRQIPTVLAVAV